MNKVTPLDVEVQPYAFTTKSIYVGHTDYKYLRWQVLDTPGILDRPLEERNTIEMQSITAMAHLRAVRPVHRGRRPSSAATPSSNRRTSSTPSSPVPYKPLVIAVNKTDVRKLEDLKPEDAALIAGMRAAVRRPASLQLGEEEELPTMSTLNEEGVMDVKRVCCDKLLAARVEQKLASRRAGESAQPIARGAAQALAASFSTGGDSALRRSTARGRRPASSRWSRRRSSRRRTATWGSTPRICARTTCWTTTTWKYDIVPEIYDPQERRGFHRSGHRRAPRRTGAGGGRAGGRPVGDEPAELAMEAEEDMDDDAHPDPARFARVAPSSSTRVRRRRAPRTTPGAAPHRRPRTPTPPSGATAAAHGKSRVSSARWCRLEPGAFAGRGTRTPGGTSARTRFLRTPPKPDPARRTPFADGVGSLLDPVKAEAAKASRRRQAWRARRPGHHRERGGAAREPGPDRRWPRGRRTPPDEQAALRRGGAG